MSNHIIIRMELNFYTPKDLAKLLKETPALKWYYSNYEPDLTLFEANLNLLKHFILPNLLHQTSQDYKCFIQYNWQLKSLFNNFLQEYGELPSHIEIMPREGPGEKRTLPSIIRNYIESISMDEKDTLTFVKWDSNFLYGLNLIHYLQHYEVVNNQKLLLLDHGYLYNMSSKQLLKENLPPFNGMIFLCTPKEYKKYFKVYDEIYTFGYGKFSEFPYAKIQEVPYMLLKGEKDFKNLENLNPDVTDQLRHFIKII